MPTPEPVKIDDRGAIGAFATRVLVAIALVAGAVLVWRMHDVLLLVFAAILVAVILHAAADGLCRFLPLAKGFALALAGLLIVALLGGVGTLFGRELGGQLSELSAALPDAWQRFAEWVGEDRVQSVVDSISPDGSTVASVAQSAFGMVATTLSGLMLAILGGIYLAISPGMYQRGALRLLPPRARTPVGEATAEAAQGLRNWLFGQLISMAATGIAVFTGLTLIGVPSALALAIVAGLLEFIPLIGPFLGAVPAVLIALTVGVDTFAWTVGFFVVWQQIEGNAMAPLVMRYAVSIPPAVTLFALFLFGGLFGPIGVLLGGPLTVATWILVTKLWVERMPEREA
ncbi:AI-2E family transporter [Sphingomonas sp. RS2018]